MKNEAWCLIYLFSLVSIFHPEQHPAISPDETIDLEKLDVIIYNLVSICKFYLEIKKSEYKKLKKLSIFNLFFIESVFH